MANITTTTIREEGPRNAVVSLTGILDTADVNLVSVITLASLTNNDKKLTFIGLAIKKVDYSISAKVAVKIAFNATTPQQVLPLAGRGMIDASGYGHLQPTTGAAGYDGSINLTTISDVALSAAVPTVYTIILQLVKLYT